MQMKKGQQGFTLIELMIVVAIIGILAAVAIPAYQDYISRSQVSEAFSMTSGAKTAIAEYAQINGEYPTTETSPSQSDLTVAGQYADAAVGGTGVITVTMKGTGIVAASVADKVITLTPPSDLTAVGGSFRWACGSTGDNKVDQKFLPKSCVSS
jgi:type IV pilus assembly protein PilA